MSEFALISKPYMLALNVAIHQTPQGLAADPLWAKDLLRHLDYIENLTLVCPVTDKAAPDLHLIRHPRLRIITYEQPSSVMRGILSLPKLIRLLWREVGRSSVVHTGVAGWPIPLGLILIPIARFRGRKSIIIVESAPWRVVDASTSKAKKLEARVRERLASSSISSADYVAYTQPEYQRSMPAKRAGGGVISPASWVDEADLIADPARSWTEKRGRNLRLLFAGRLVAEKGVFNLLDALRLLPDADLACDFIGSGPEAGAIEAAASRDGRIRLLRPVEYGGPFLELVAEYHAVVVPSISDEQPRIVFDSYSQAVPVIASNTAGLLSCVESGVTGAIFPSGDASALAEAISRAAADNNMLEAMGMAAFKRATSTTHREMHAKRSHAIAQLLS